MYDDPAVARALASENPDWRSQDGLLYFRNRLYIPRQRNLRADILHAHHDAPTAGHPGSKKTLELINRSYYWPTMAQDVTRYVAGCEACQRTKISRQRPISALHPLDPPPEPWHTISIDFVGPLPESRGFNHLCHIVDLHSKRIHLIPTHSNIDSIGTAMILRDHVFRLHGIPRRVVSDRGTQFVSAFMKDLHSLLGIEGNPSTAYHPQTDGQTERLNQEVEQFLRLYVNHHQDDWVNGLSMAEFAYNDHDHSATGISPFFADFGRHPFKGTNLATTTVDKDAQTFAERLANVREEVTSSLSRAKELSKIQYDKRHRAPIDFEPGTKVWLDAKNIRTDRPLAKLDDLRYGPFEIIEKVNASSYRLALPPGWRDIHLVFNESLLTPFKPAVFEQQQPPPPPPPDVIAGHEEHEVEEILDSKLVRGKLKYLIKWKGWDRSWNLWVPLANVSNAKRAVAAFHKKRPDKPRADAPPKRRVKQTPDPDTSPPRRNPLRTRTFDLRRGVMLRPFPDYLTLLPSIVFTILSRLP